MGAHSNIPDHAAARKLFLESIARWPGAGPSLVALRRPTGWTGGATARPQASRQRLSRQPGGFTTRFRPAPVMSEYV